MTKSGGGTICISVPSLQILGGLVPPVPPVIYAHDPSSENPSCDYDREGDVTGDECPYTAAAAATLLAARR